MAGLAFVFPGQGVQAPGMGRTLYRQSKAARALMDGAERRMPGLLRACFEGPAEALERTDLAQPALLTVELALQRAAEEIGLRPQALAGFSLGEWSAVQAAGMLPFEVVFDLVRARGRWMQACAERRPGGMSAVLRLDAEQVQRALLDHPDVVAANHNAPGQTVVAGPLAALARFEEAARALGGRCLRLRVAGAFHSPLMLPASDRLADALAGLPLAAPAVPVYANLTARPYSLPVAREWLALQPSQAVQWTDSIRRMAGQGIDSFLELGPGGVLCGLIARILPGARCLGAEDAEGLTAARARLKEDG